MPMKRFDFRNAANIEALNILGLGKQNQAGDISDGRIRRGLRTRQALIDAFLTLAGDLGRVPSAGDVAIESGRSMRLVFERFPRLDLLASAAVLQLLSKSRPDAYHLFAGCDRHKRVAKAVDMRVRVFERWRPLWWLITSTSARDKDCRAQLRQYESCDKVFLETIFRPELSLLSHERRSDTCACLELLLGAENWVALRDKRGMSLLEASTFLKKSVDRIIYFASVETD